MIIKNKKIYETEDGKIFDTEEEALLYEKKIKENTLKLENKKKNKEEIDRLRQEQEAAYKNYLNKHDQYYKALHEYNKKYPEENNGLWDLLSWINI